jgi:hypothetical protein
MEGIAGQSHKQEMWDILKLQANIVLDILHGGKIHNYIHHCSMASQGHE